jgi:YVTN family beta-propeller protein
MRSQRLAALIVLGALAALAAPAPALASQAPPVTEGTQSVLFVGNNWDGTADIIDPQTFERLERVNVIPDIDERMQEIATDPERLAFYLLIQQFIGEGNDQYVDDMFSSHDGRFMYVSRPSLADVVGIDLATHEIVWRFPMEGVRSDHMAISPDGTRLLVSDSTANKVHELDTETGEKVGEFESGDSPHENNYSKDGSRVFHASIGLVYTPLDRPAFDTTKGDRWFQVVDADTNEILKRLDIGEILEEHGHSDYSSAVRPMALNPEETVVYLQLSFFHGFVVFDLEGDVPIELVDLPNLKPEQQREEYVLDSAHHGIAMNPEGTKLCVAGTMSDYAAIVDVETYEPTIHEGVTKPYWATNSADGRYCFVSASKDDQVVVIDYATEEVVTRFDVGTHPQRMRMAVVRSEFLQADEPEPPEGDGDGSEGAEEEGGAGDGTPPPAEPAAQRALPATGSSTMAVGLVALVLGVGARLLTLRRRRVS